MRYTRLRRQIEGGTLIGSHGIPFSGGAHKIAQVSEKRKRVAKAGEICDQQHAGSASIRIKPEFEYSTDGFETDSSYDSDSEDEMPLAKRKMSRALADKAPYPTPPTAMCSKPPLMVQDVYTHTLLPNPEQHLPRTITNDICATPLGGPWMTRPAMQFPVFSLTQPKQPGGSDIHEIGNAHNITPAPH